ncbi:hypothetical protein D0Z00_000319 [Geotrichum galactomycetum]|uniref:Uncharacterized protein n=1 Tax=Geotrichum galactomycetum TaxID=27317 RepID=A0ACB6VA65_9ASCO|nr:hypothetical protein D0Z00_000319 [Geotrichum candidum]
MALVSAAPFIALLDEPDYDLKAYALESLDQHVDHLWAEIADHISQIHYIFLAQQNHDTPPKDLKDATPIEPALVAVVEKMLQRCVAKGEYKLALGVALDARRLDTIDAILRSTLEKTDDAMELINYVLNCSVTVVSNREFRNKTLNSLVPIITSLPSPDYFAIAKIIVQLNDYNLAITLFNNLLQGSEKSKELIAYQVAFDLVASASQELLEKVHSEFSTKTTPEYEKLTNILSGIPTCDYNLTFLEKNNQTDSSILNKTKTLLDGRSSMFHSAVTFQNAFLHAGTTADNFFRTNLEWLGKATNWTKFSATAALGVIHQGNLTQGRRILQPYFPGSPQGSCYTQGGSLYALGIIFAGHGREVIEYLRNQVVSTAVQGHEDEVVLHGASLGLGVAGMGSGNTDIYEELKAVLYNDSAIAGEGAGLAMGLVMLGSADETVLDEMLQYARETQHEKIIRSLAMGIALLMYGKEEAADSLIEILVTEQSPILRYGGAFTIALAYAGTGNNKAIKRLLHMAVSDASDDVRRASVIALGFIFLRNHTAVPRMVELLSESHNPHVRYGTALALGISCAGTGLKEAVEVLEPMMKDSVDFVRQGASISLAMILIQQNEKTFPKVKSIHETFASVVQNKHEDAMSKFGAALAQGIIDAGGRNVTISLENAQTGSLNMKAVVGLAVFTQFWYWFPLTHFLSLSFTPTTIVGVGEDLHVPKFDFTCNAKPKHFGYPPKVEEQSEKQPTKVETAILSTTNKAKNRARKSSKAFNKLKEGTEEIETKIPEKVKEEADDDKMDTEEDKTQASPKEEVEDTEIVVDQDYDNFETELKKQNRRHYKVDNMSRVVPAQLKYITFEGQTRFVPVRRFRGTGGVLVVTDQSPEEPKEFIETVRQKYELENGDAPLPRPFVYEDDELEYN